MIFPIQISSDLQEYLGREVGQRVVVIHRVVLAGGADRGRDKVPGSKIKHQQTDRTEQLTIS